MSTLFDRKHLVAVTVGFYAHAGVQADASRLDLENSSYCGRVCCAKIRNLT